MILPRLDFGPPAPAKAFLAADRPPEVGEVGGRAGIGLIARAACWLDFRRGGEAEGPASYAEAWSASVRGWTSNEGERHGGSLNLHHRARDRWPAGTRLV